MSGLKTHVTWLPVLANTRGCGSNFSCRQSSQPCGFNRKRSKTTLPKTLGAALRLPWGLRIGSWFSNQSISTGWNFSILLSFWCLHLGFISSTRHCEDGGRSSRHLCEYRPPCFPWTCQARWRGFCPPGFVEMFVWLCFPSWEVGADLLLKFLPITQYLGAFGILVHFSFQKKKKVKEIACQVYSLKSAWCK